MKVLIINATFGSGSTGTIVKDIQEVCNLYKIDCKVAYAYSSIPRDKIDGYKIGNFISNKLHAILSRVNGRQGYFSLLSTLNLIKIIDREKPDIINIHNLHSNFVNINMLLTAIGKRNLPLVVTLHDCWYFTGGCFHFTNAHCEKWKSSCTNCPKKRQDIPAYFIDMASNILRDRYKYFSKVKNLYIVGVSDWIRGIACQTVFKGRKSSTIHNGLDISIFHPINRDLKKEFNLKGYKIILGPGSKWLDTVNGILLKKVSDSLAEDERLLLFGCNPSNQPALSNVIYMGYIKDRDYLAKLYSMADLFVNCSREDTLSTINLEAQACGTPIITYNNTGSVETAHPTYSRCVPTGDVQGFINTIKELINIKIDHSNEIASWVAQNFEKNTNYKKYIDLFSSIE